MKIPKKIKIGGRNIEVIIDERTGVEGYNGTTWVDRGVIFLDKTMKEEPQTITFLHEIIHIILHQLDYKRVRFDDKGEKVEWICTTLSNSLYQVLKDNDLLK